MKNLLQDDRDHDNGSTNCRDCPCGCLIKLSCTWGFCTTHFYETWSFSQKLHTINKTFLLAQMRLCKPFKVMKNGRDVNVWEVSRMYDRFQGFWEDCFFLLINGIELQIQRKKWRLLFKIVSYFFCRAVFYFYYFLLPIFINFSLSTWPDLLS